MSIKPGPLNLITDVEGIRVGNAEDRRAMTGTTVILTDMACAAGVDVRGGGPGTRETDLLAATCRVDQIDAVVLSGGSAFGLAAGDGVTQWLAAQGRGYPTRAGPVPIVPGAILFDLANGGDKSWARNRPIDGSASPPPPTPASASRSAMPARGSARAPAASRAVLAVRRR